MSEQAPDWSGLIGRAIAGEDLSDADTAAAMTAMMRGEASASRVAGLLVALRAKGETAEELAGLVASMRGFALAIDAPADAVDTCGTGGDRSGTFNVSTLAAIVAAGAGATVVKHGNRAASSKCGSADVLEGLGVVVDLEPAGVQACVDEIGIGFCYAPMFHPAMRHVMPVRRELGVATAFNFLGPLSNPASVAHQTIGVSDPAMAERMAQVLARLGARHALVFHGADGLDELSTTGRSEVWEVRGGDVEQWTLDPTELGLAPARLEDLHGGGEVEACRAVADRVLSGERGAPRDIVLLGAAAALYAADRTDSLAKGLDEAERALDEGRAAEVLRRWARRSQELRPA